MHIAARYSYYYNSGGSYSDDANEVFERYTSLSNSEKTGIARFVDHCVDDGNWLLMRELQIRAALGGVNGLVGSMGRANAINNGAVFGANGATGNGTTTYIDTGINLSTIGILQNDALILQYVYDAGTLDASRALFGGNVGTERTQIFTTALGTYSTGINSVATADTGIAIADGHLIGVGRGNGTTNYFEVDGVIVDTNAVNSAALSNINLYELARNNNGVAANFSDGTSSLLCVTRGIGFNRVSFHLAVNQLMSDLGVFFLDRFPYQIPHTLV